MEDRQNDGDYYRSGIEDNWTEGLDCEEDVEPVVETDCGGGETLLLGETATDSEPGIGDEDVDTGI